MPEYKCPECGHVTYRTVPQKHLTCIKCGRTWSIELGGTIEIVYPERNKVPLGYLVRGRTLTPEEFHRKVEEAQAAGMNFFDYVEEIDPKMKIHDPLIRFLSRGGV